MLKDMYVAPKEGGIQLGCFACHRTFYHSLNLINLDDVLEYAVRHSDECTREVSLVEPSSADPHVDSKSLNDNPCLHTWECEGSWRPHMCMWGRGHSIPHKCEVCAVEQALA